MTKETFEKPKHEVLSPEVSKETPKTGFRTGKVYWVKRPENDKCDGRTNILAEEGALVEIDPQSGKLKTREEYFLEGEASSTHQH
jgi:membrane carboxypeptidase/penicillin-binding protein